MKKYIYAILPVLVFTVLQGAMGVAVMIPEVVKNANQIAEAHGDTSAIMSMIPMESLALAVLLSGVFSVVVISLLKMIKWKTVMDVTSVNWAKAVCYVAAAAIGIFALDLLEEIMDLPNIIEGELTGMASTAIGFITIGILGPVCEELIFREGVLGYMLRNNVHPWRAVIISAVMFGMVHGNPAQVPFAAAMGIVLGYIYFKTGNAVVPSIIHIINNSIACIQMNTLGDKAKDFSMVEMVGGMPVAIVIIVVGIALCAWALSKIGKDSKTQWCVEQ